MRDDSAADQAASLVGRAVGICTLLRGMGHHASHGQAILPLEVGPKACS